jgi:hypothetical protein
MPNHMYNALTIKADTNKAQEILKCIGNDNSINGDQKIFDFSRVIPTPNAKDYEENWYDWNIKHWSTKWNAYDCSIESNTVHFTTAYCCPTKVLRKLSKLFPDTKFHYEFQEEIDEDFKGVYTIEIGCLIHHPEKFAKFEYLKYKKN